jgi:glycosyltransferase involved in cell wall biosynthesis
VRCFNKPESYAHKREKEILLHSKLVVCVSHDMDIKVRKMTNERIPTLTFYYGVDANRLRIDPELRKEVRSKLDLNENNPAIVFVGFQKKHKGIYELIQSFRDISYIYPLARLILVGEIIEPRRIKRAIAANGLTSKVILTGGVPYEDILGYLNAADVFAFPSWEEGLPNAVMEACACELPIVASNVGGIPEMIQHEKNGLLISPRDVSGLTKNIKRLLEFPDKARELGVAAREKILKDFDYNKNGKILADRMYKLIYDSNAIL